MVGIMLLYATVAGGSTAHQRNLDGEAPSREALNSDAFPVSQRALRHVHVVEGRTAFELAVLLVYSLILAGQNCINCRRAISLEVALRVLLCLLASIQASLHKPIL